MVDMSHSSNYDDVLMNVLMESKTLIGFFHSIFGFLARRTDFYYIPENPEENFGFPAGVAEELVVKVLRKCDPMVNGHLEVSEDDVSSNCDPNMFIPTTVAQEIEVITSIEHDHNYEESIPKENPSKNINIENLNSENNLNLISNHPTTCNNIPHEQNSEDDINLQSLSIYSKFDDPSHSVQNSPIDNGKPHSETNHKSEQPKEFSAQKCSETYNGAYRDKYCWSQTIGELDVTIKLPPSVTSSKLLKVDITSDAIFIQFLTQTKKWTSLIQDKLIYKVKQGETVWVMSEGFIRINLEKQSERWWNALFVSEPTIDTSKIDCSRPLHDLPEDHVEKVRELQWNHLQRLSGKPTSDELKQREILRTAWEQEGSPFVNIPFNPEVLHKPM